MSAPPELGARMAVWVTAPSAAGGLQACPWRLPGLRLPQLHVHPGLGDHFLALQGLQVAGRALEGERKDWELDRPRFQSLIIYSLWDLEPVDEASVSSPVQRTTTTYQPGRVLVITSGDRHGSPMRVLSLV